MSATIHTYISTIGADLALKRLCFWWARPSPIKAPLLGIDHMSHWSSWTSFLAHRICNTCNGQMKAHYTKYSCLLVHRSHLSDPEHRKRAAKPGNAAFFSWTSSLLPARTRNGYILRDISPHQYVLWHPTPLGIPQLLISPPRPQTRSSHNKENHGSFQEVG